MVTVKKRYCLGGIPLQARKDEDYTYADKNHNFDLLTKIRYQLNDNNILRVRFKTYALKPLYISYDQDSERWYKVLRVIYR